MPLGLDPEVSFMIAQVNKIFYDSYTVKLLRLRNTQFSLEKKEALFSKRRSSSSGKGKQQQYHGVNSQI
jgi:hypothetical protein